MDSPSVDKTREMFEQWELYYAIIRHNHMLHHDLPPRLNERFTQLSKPLQVLDLGSGDGYMAYQSLRGMGGVEYHAVDLSADALKRLDAETPDWNGRKQMHVGDFSSVLPTFSAASYDLVFANYSLHHLSTAQKSDLLTEIDRVLKQEGLFVWTDVVLNEDENREEYLSRLANVMRGWDGLTPQQQERGIQHIRDCDFPEKLSWMMAELTQLGWSCEAELIRDATFGSWLFRREQS